MLFDKVSVFDGYFVPASDAPAAFKDINLIQVLNPSQAQSPPFGYLELKTRKSKFSLLKPALDGTNLSFKTRAVLGISYEFSGTLPRIEYENPDELSRADVVLSGTLKKIQAGKVIAEGKVAFSWFAGD